MKDEEIQAGRLSEESTVRTSGILKGTAKEKNEKPMDLPTRRPRGKTEKKPVGPSTGRSRGKPRKS